MYWTLCQIDADDAERYSKLKPLKNGEAVEVVDERNIWHPAPGNRVDDPVNRRFIKELVDRVMDDEKVSKLLPGCEINAQVLMNSPAFS